ncbi:MAG TPA: 4-amino-4-deoxychorismate lyase [Cyanobacteria bacterium UBA8803]|nr:4-amino-4-deoxychorismate lyase [Cyanobacteria bacterium UBA9273]HBL60573.1 4-amino-4-deoxychorismate lyase [Cyanobacteria bacterium UBA8803]
MVQAFFWYNGTLIQGNRIDLAIDDPGLLYGATVFTTLRIYHESLDHPLTSWNAHCARLLHSLQAFGWQLPEWERLRQGAKTLLASFPVLRIVIFPDGREWITGRPLPEDLRERQQQGVTAWLADGLEFRRSLPTYKTGNYLGGWLALQKAQLLGAKEAILVDDRGNWLETATGNLWGWQDGCWWTPPVAAGILPGVMRSQLIGWLTQKGLTVQEVTWDRELVKGFEAIAYSNSVMQVIPIHTLLNPQQLLRYPLLTSPLEQLRSLFYT